MLKPPISVLRCEKMIVSMHAAVETDEGSRSIVRKKLDALFYELLSHSLIDRCTRIDLW